MEKGSWLITSPGKPGVSVLVAQFDVGCEVLKGIISREGLTVKAAMASDKGGVPMQNVQFEVQGDQLVIVVDLSQEFGESASGKSIIVATTGGNVSVPGHEEVKIGLNAYRPVPVTRSARRGR